MEVPGIEPGAFRMQSERDTTTPHPQGYEYCIECGIWTESLIHFYIFIFISNIENTQTIKHK